MCVSFECLHTLKQPISAITFASTAIFYSRCYVYVLICVFAIETRFSIGNTPIICACVFVMKINIVNAFRYNLSTYYYYVQRLWELNENRIFQSETFINHKKGASGGRLLVGTCMLYASVYYYFEK